jgi:hypothetical protein
MKASRESPEQITEGILRLIAKKSTEARLRGLGDLARKVFLDRNAHGFNRPGMPKSDRVAIKKEMRPYLRQAIHWARKSRDALFAGDIKGYEFLRDRARMYRAFAALEVFRPYANKHGKNSVAIAARSGDGGRGKAKAAEAEKKNELIELEALIKGCIARGDSYRVKEWADGYNMSRSALYRRINKLENDLKKKA